MSLYEVIFLVVSTIFLVTSLIYLGLVQQHFPVWIKPTGIWFYFSCVFSKSIAYWTYKIIFLVVSKIFICRKSNLLGTSSAKFSGLNQAVWILIFFLCIFKTNSLLNLYNYFSCRKYNIFVGNLIYLGLAQQHIQVWIKPFWILIFFLSIFKIECLLSFRNHYSSHKFSFSCC